MIGRMYNLIRGLVKGWLGRREQQNPEAVYETAIQERLTQYATLREAAAGVLYLRAKLVKELESKAAELMHLRRQLELAVDSDDDDAALSLISRRDAITAEVDRLTTDLTELTTEADVAKRNLSSFQNEIARLRDEKVRMVARMANAKARLRLQETLNGMSLDADIRALDEIRDHINRLVTESQLSREIGDTDLERRLGSIREAEATAAARAQLDEMKRSRKSRLLPLVLPQQEAVAS